MHRKRSNYILFSSYISYLIGFITQKNVAKPWNLQLNQSPVNDGPFLLLNFYIILFLNLSLNEVKNVTVITNKL